MPRQNRISPFGELIATSARGTFMGNRGVLHNDQGQLTAKRWAHQQWIICLLDFKDRKRKEMMMPGCYTELFFLDEATALAAGHRPCWECNRERYNQFRAAWIAGNPGFGFSLKVPIKEIDKVLHAERVDKLMRKVTWRCYLQELPDGVFVNLPEEPDNCYLLKGDRMHLWTPAGYTEQKLVTTGAEVLVLTPKSSVNAIQAGFKVITLI